RDRRPARAWTYSGPQIGKALAKAAGTGNDPASIARLLPGRCRGARRYRICLSLRGSVGRGRAPTGKARAPRVVLWARADFPTVTQHHDRSGRLAVSVRRDLRPGAGFGKHCLVQTEGTMMTMSFSRRRLAVPAAAAALALGLAACGSEDGDGGNGDA